MCVRQLQRAAKPRRIQMTRVEIRNASASVRDRELFTSGMVGAKICFSFDDAWNGLVKTAVFSCNGRLFDVPESEWNDDICTVPHECLSEGGVALTVGVYGVSSDGDLAIPTVYATLGYVQKGAEPCGEVGASPSLPIWMSLQEQIGDLSLLETESGADLVGAINEAASKAGSISVAMDIADGYIRYSTDGSSFTPLIALSELKGDKGDKGNDGADGENALCIIYGTAVGSSIEFFGLPDAETAFSVAKSAYSANKDVMLNVTNVAGDWETLLRLCRVDPDNMDFSNYEITLGDSEPRLQYVRIDSSGAGTYSYFSPQSGE